MYLYEYIDEYYLKMKLLIINKKLDFLILLYSAFNNINIFK